jgi:hypothetical protein
MSHVVLRSCFHLPELAAAVLLCAVSAFGQTSVLKTDAPQTAGPGSGRFAQLGPEPAVPADPLELVTGDAQPPQNAEQRASIIHLLSNAVALSNVRAFPYHRRTSFNAFGSTASDGAWQLEDMSPGGGLYRWTAQGPSYSVTNLYLDQVLYSSEPSGAIPLRLAQVRTAIFFTRPVIGPRATLRTASGQLNGLALTCVLLSHMGAAKGATGGRHWSESEWCVDNASGALVTQSPVPGLYTAYDYSQAIHFHDRLIPNKFTVTEAGRTIIEAQTLSVSDPPKDASLFEPAGLAQVGAGSLMSSPWSFRSIVPSATVAPGSTQFVTLHAVQSATGEISGAEVLASSNPALNQSALEQASQFSGHEPDGPEPGATPQSHQVLFTVVFVPGR